MKLISFWVKRGFGLLIFGVTLASELGAYPMNSATPVAVSGSGLQSELNSIFACTGCVGATANQSPVDMWQSSTAQNPTVTAVLQFSNLPSGDTFGIWSNTSNLVPIINGSASPTGPLGFSTSAVLQWSTTGALLISSPALGCFDGDIDCGIAANVSANDFGFYLQTPTATYYTVDSLNPNNAAQALAYNYNDEWVLAFNDTAVTSSSVGAYDNFVVGIQSISGLPEPRSFVLLATTIPLFAFIRYRWLRRQKA